MADESVSQAIQYAGNAINSFASTAESRKGLQRQYDYWKKSADYQNEINQKNYEKQRDDAYKREDYLNANSKQIEVNAMRNAGLNPAWNEAGAGVSSSSVSGANMADAPSGQMFDVGSSHFNDFFKNNIESQQLQLSMELQKAQIESLKEQNKKTAAETTAIDNENKGVEEENEWTSKLMNKRIRFDNESNSFIRKSGEYDENGNPILETVNFRTYPTTAKGIQAMQSYTKFCDESSTYVSHEIENNLKHIVGILQIQDDNILKALANTPAEAFRNMKANADSTELNTEIERIKKIVWTKVKGIDDERLKVLTAILLTYAKM